MIKKGKRRITITLTENVYNYIKAISNYYGRTPSKYLDDYFFKHAQEWKEKQ